ncbi:hypothetical protein CC86DRAFT_455681 [Ophiobolus disseminans]|uniref:Uncharacterized protein n=1 Tax=Ophiobolus disseminans TaxID=1469910 RepID=A0A6A6ZZY8_9PLEO|nr:hypothetical protein CC86DRAFT_455681 [Ophiobolus disseminans]
MCSSLEGSASSTPQVDETQQQLGGSASATPQVNEPQTQHEGSLSQSTSPLIPDSDDFDEGLKEEELVELLYTSVPDAVQTCGKAKMRNTVQPNTRSKGKSRAVADDTSHEDVDGSSDDEDEDEFVIEGMDDDFDGTSQGKRLRGAATTRSSKRAKDNTGQRSRINKGGKSNEQQPSLSMYFQPTTTSAGTSATLSIAGPSSGTMSSITGPSGASLGTSTIAGSTPSLHTTALSTADRTAKSMRVLPGTWRGKMVLRVGDIT